MWGSVALTGVLYGLVCGGGGHNGIVITVDCLEGRCVNLDWMGDRISGEPTGRECKGNRLWEINRKGACRGTMYRENYVNCCIIVGDGAGTVTSCALLE